MLHPATASLHRISRCVRTANASGAKMMPSRNGDGDIGYEEK
jgi:hypothetical protein